MTPRHSIHKLIEQRQMGLVDAHSFSASVLRSETMVQRLQSSYDVKGHEGCVNAINFNQSGSLMVTGSDDGTVRIWNIGAESAECVDVLTGHVSNVFAVNFLPYSNDRVVISGGNDGDVRVYDLDAHQCRVFRHHKKKVLRLAPNPHMPNTFLSCSADGTVHMIDTRSQYADTSVERVGTGRGQGAGGINSDRASAEVIPQALGGGRRRAFRNNSNEGVRESLLVDYDLPASHTGRELANDQTLYFIDVNPADGNKFIVGSSDGLVREFDIRNNSTKSSDSYVNVFGLADPYNAGSEVTGCCYSHDGREIVATYLSDQIYVFDATINYEKDHGVDFFNKRQRKRKREEGSTGNRRRHRETEEGSDNTSQFRVMIQGRSGTRVVTLQDLLDGGEDEDENDEGDDEEEEEEQESEAVIEPPQTYKQVYKGHVSFQTIKGCSFYGPESQYIISGSDDSRIFVWEKESGALLRVFTGHDSIVNTVTPAPYFPLLASGGIDSYVKIWMPAGDHPDESTMQQRREQMQRIQQGNEERSERRSQLGGAGGIYSLLFALLGGGLAREDSDE